MKDGREEEVMMRGKYKRLGGNIKGGREVLKVGGKQEKREGSGEVKTGSGSEERGN